MTSPKCRLLNVAPWLPRSNAVAATMVVSADHFAGRLQLRPDAGVLISGLLGVGDNGQRRRYRFEIFPTFGLLRFDGSFHAVPEFSYGDGSLRREIAGFASHEGGTTQEGAQ